MSIEQAARFSVLVATEEQTARGYRADGWYPMILLPGMEIAAMVRPNQRGNWYFEPDLLDQHACTKGYARKLQTLDFLTDSERGRRQVTYYRIRRPIPAAAARVANNPHLGPGGAIQYYIMSSYVGRLERHIACFYGSEAHHGNYRYLSQRVSRA